MMIMSFDYGLSHIGVALGSTDTGLAEPLAVIDASGRKNDLKEIAKLIHAHHPEKLIVGISENLSARKSLVNILLCWADGIP